MDNDWLDGNWASNYGTPEFLTSDRPRAGTAAEHPSPVAQPASQAADRVDEPGRDHVLPLLRLSGWNADKQYDKNNLARHVCSDTDPDLVLAPGDFWNVDFQERLESLLQDEDKFPGDTYTCEETIIEISVERSRQRGLSKRYKKLGVDWQIVDEHKEVTSNTTTAKGKKKKKSATEAQKLQRAADAGLWTRLYELRRCRARHCKHGPHCLPDEQGIHRKILPARWL